MEYQIWTKTEFGEQYDLVKAEGEEAVKRELLEALKAGREPILTVEVPFDLQLKIKQPGDQPKKTPARKSKDESEKPEEDVKSEADENPPE